MKQIILALLGVCFSTLVKLQSLKRDAKVANVEFSNKKYFQTEAVAMILSLISVPVWYIVFPEVSVKYPALIGWELCTYFVMGSSGAWIIQKILGSTKNWIRNITDVKTNIADDKLDKK